MRSYLRILGRMRRRPGTLLPLEIAICEAAVQLKRSGAAEFHGYELARHIGDAAQQRLLTAYGTLYRALSRLDEMGLLRSRQEEAATAARENRPRRRLYRLTTAGEEAVKQTRATRAIGERAARWRRRPVTA